MTSPHRGGRHLLAVLAALTILCALASPGSAASSTTSTTITGWSTKTLLVNAGEPARVSVRVRDRGTGAGRTTVLQWRPDAGAWRSVDRARTDRQGRVVLSWRPSASGQVRVQVATAGRTKPAATTSARQVTVVADESSPAPTTPTTPADPAPLVDQDAGAVVELVNQARARARRCGGDLMPAVPPLSVDRRLTAAAQKYATRMATEDFFSHDGPAPDRSTFSERITREGYHWSSAGENIAAGYATADEVVEGWLDSPGHCRNIMSGRFREIGVGVVLDAPASASYPTYWSQSFGTQQ